MQLVHSAQDIRDTFTPWHKDPCRIATLYRWLVLMDRAPADVWGLIEHAEGYQQDYEDMQLWSPS